MDPNKKSSSFTIRLVPQIIHDLNLPHIDYLVVLEDIYGLQNYSKEKVCFKSGQGFSDSWGREKSYWNNIVRDLIKRGLVTETQIKNQTRRKKRILEVTNEFLKVRDKYIGSIKY
jgi:hypothetical protein